MAGVAREHLSSAETAAAEAAGAAARGAVQVCTDIILANAFCDEEHPPHKVEQAELALRAGSIAILSLFVLEWLLEVCAPPRVACGTPSCRCRTPRPSPHCACRGPTQSPARGACSHPHRAAQAFAHGVRRWARSAIHLVDLVIVCVSLVLEVVATALHNRNLEIASLLVVFRLWRVVRVMHAVSDVQHHVKDEGKLSLQRRVQKLLSIQDAHHTVIKELHREYTERVRSPTHPFEPSWVSAPCGVWGCMAGLCAAPRRDDPRIVSDDSGLHVLCRVYGVYG